MKYSILFNNNTGTQYFNATQVINSGATLGGHSQTLTSNNGLSSYNNNEFKDKDTHLTREIRLECIKTLKSFINTKVCLLNNCVDKTYFIKYYLLLIKVWNEHCFRKSYNFDGHCDSHRLQPFANNEFNMFNTCRFGGLGVFTLIKKLIGKFNHLCFIKTWKGVDGHWWRLKIYRKTSILFDRQRIDYKRWHWNQSMKKLNFISKFLNIFIYDLQISSMVLINALICHAENVDFKIHLRSDFARCGLIPAIEVIFYKF